MKPIWFTCLIVLSTTFGVSAQSQKQLIKVGDDLFAQQDYYGASKWYKEALMLDSTYLDLLFKYAESLRLYNDYAKAEWHYQSIYKQDQGKSFPLAPYWYSMMLKYNGKYADAKKNFKKSKRYFQSDKKGFYYQKINQEIKACDVAVQILKDSLPIDVKNIGNSINTYNSELGATLLSDSTLIFSSLRDEKMKENNEVTDTSYYLLKLFKGIKNGDIWVSDKKLNDEVNEKGYHIANGCLNSKGNTFYYNRCNRNLHCKIYAVPVDSKGFGLPYEVVGVNHETATTTQPFATEISGKEVLFFSSNREGGIGMMDIWYSIKENDHFQSPENMGKIINTIEDEITPFYDTKDSNLYFSSNWHEGLGGFDVFKVKTDLKTTEKVKNAGFPINTSTNDFYYSIRSNTVLLASNRKGSYTKKGETCCNDIYYYEIPDTSKKIYTTLEELNRYLPVRLYFHNDVPNPRSRDTVTTLNYLTTYKEYTRLYPEYKREYSNGLKGVEKDDALVEIEDLFSSNIDKGAKDLEMFTPLLIKELENGNQIALTIKGFASPLSKSDYNVNLTLRRISSLINYLSEYDHGRILPYINGSATNGGALYFTKVPFGEYQSKEISDDLEDKRNSVYSPGAAVERKIEIIAISVTDTVGINLDGSEIEKLPILTITDSVLIFEPETVEKQFQFTNSGEAALKLFAAEFSHSGFEINLPNSEVQVGETAYFQIKKLPLVTKGNYTVTLLTNTIPNRIVVPIVLN
ncbi:MAG: hypothetical protein IT232_03395 [Flavobacteriales bacterium]|nr:hypothetical protein [Flavobacteriales bacterium]